VRATLIADRRRLVLQLIPSLLKAGAGAAMPAAGGGLSLNFNEEIVNIARRTAPLGGGCIVAFIGYVKGRVNGEEVESLELAPPPDASLKIDEVRRWALGQEGVLDVRIYLAAGALKPGDIITVVFVAARNREAAFPVAMEVVNRLKREVAVKRERRRASSPRP